MNSTARSRSTFPAKTSGTSAWVTRGSVTWSSGAYSPEPPITPDPARAAP
ncbi:hypothetical protein ACGF13_28240 [Kitasatospora sp. NPDC048286]